MKPEPVSIEEVEDKDFIIGGHLKKRKMVMTAAIAVLLQLLI
jgi:hypothetical protein